MHDPTDNEDRSPAPRPPSARPPSARPAPPPPARGGARKPARPRQRDRRGPAARTRNESTAKPTPARLVEGSRNGTGGEPDVPETVIEHDGRLWTVRLLGRARGGPSTGAVPLLLLGFWEGQGASACGPPALEHLMVGRTLCALSPGQLEVALERARPCAPHDRAGDGTTSGPCEDAEGNGRGPGPSKGRPRGGGRMSRRPPRP